jgi:hypothetical protein
LKEKLDSSMLKIRNTDFGLTDCSQDCRIAGLQDCRIAGLQDCRIAGLQDCRIAGLQDCRIAGLQGRIK